MAKSTEENREITLNALSRLKERKALPVVAESRSEVRHCLGVRLSNSQLFDALQSLHYKYGGVVLARTGTSDGGMGRGWHVDLTRPSMCSPTGV